MTTTTPLPTGTTMLPSSVQNLLKARGLDWYRRTLRNAIRGAQRNNETLYVGRTYTGAHITRYPGDNVGLSLDYACHADGSVVKYI